MERALFLHFLKVNYDHLFDKVWKIWIKNLYEPWMTYILHCKWIHWSFSPNLKLQAGLIFLCFRMIKSIYSNTALFGVEEEKLRPLEKLLMSLEGQLLDGVILQV